jgi:hypothetical protein
VIRPTGAALVVLVLAGSGAAHWVAPEAVVAGLNDARTRETAGVERAERDGKAPRLLVIRVGERWYGLSEAARRRWAEEWERLWRESVPQGVVSILDARTDTPVVRFGPRGRVTGVAARPAS